LTAPKNISHTNTSNVVNRMTKRGSDSGKKTCEVAAAPSTDRAATVLSTNTRVTDDVRGGASRIATMATHIKESSTYGSTSSVVPAGARNS
jgi:hypothetical protein